MVCYIHKNHSWQKLLHLTMLHWLCCYKTFKILQLEKVFQKGKYLSVFLRQKVCHLPQTCHIKYHFYGLAQLSNTARGWLIQVEVAWELHSRFSRTHNFSHWPTLRSVTPSNIKVGHADQPSPCSHPPTYSKCFIATSYLGIGISSWSPPYFGPRFLLSTPKKSWVDPHQHLLDLEVQDQTEVEHLYDRQ